MDDESDSESWHEHLRSADKSFESMVENFEEMFIDDKKIRYFRIRDGTYGVIGDSYELYKKYGEQIQKLLIPWIKCEKEEGRLFQKEHWKPFRDSDSCFETYVGYRKMFQFKKYYLQLILDINRCKLKRSLCVLCKNHEYHLCFGVAYCGWKEDGYEKLQPDDFVAIPSDNMMPFWYWKLH